MVSDLKIAYISDERDDELLEFLQTFDHTVVRPFSLEQLAEVEASRFDFAVVRLSCFESRHWPIFASLGTLRWGPRPEIILITDDTVPGNYFPELTSLGLTRASSREHAVTKIGQSFQGYRRNYVAVKVVEDLLAVVEKYFDEPAHPDLKKSFDALIMIDDRYANLLAIVAHNQCQFGNKQVCGEILRRILANFPNNHLARIYYGMGLIGMGKSKEAIRYLDPYLRYGPSSLAAPFLVNVEIDAISMNSKTPRLNAALVRCFGRKSSFDMFAALLYSEFGHGNNQIAIMLAKEYEAGLSEPLKGIFAELLALVDSSFSGYQVPENAIGIIEAVESNHLSSSPDEASSDEESINESASEEQITADFEQVDDFRGDIEAHDDAGDEIEIEADAGDEIEIEADAGDEIEIEADVVDEIKIEADAGDEVDADVAVDVVPSINRIDESEVLESNDENEENKNNEDVNGSSIPDIKFKFPKVEQADATGLMDRSKTFISIESSISKKCLTAQDYTYEGRFIVFHPDSGVGATLGRDLEDLGCQDVNVFDEIEPIFERFLTRPIAGLIVGYTKERPRGIELIRDLQTNRDFQIPVTSIFTPSNDHSKDFVLRAPALFFDYIGILTQNRSNLGRALQSAYAARQKQDSPARALNELRAHTKETSDHKNVDRGALLKALTKVPGKEVWKLAEEALWNIERNKPELAKPNIEKMEEMYPDTFMAMLVKSKFSLLTSTEEAAAEVVWEGMKSLKHLSPVTLYMMGKMFASFENTAGLKGVISAWQLDEKVYRGSTFDYLLARLALLDEQGGRQMAANYICAAIAKQPGVYSYLRFLGQVMEAQRFHYRAENVWTVAATAYEADQLEVKLGLARCFYEGRKMRRADTMVSEILKDHPQNAEALGLVSRFKRKIA